MQVSGSNCKGVLVTLSRLTFDSEIREGVRAVWESTPDHLRYDRRLRDDFHHGWLTIVYLYLNYLYTCFLLQRALIKHTNTGQEALCDISRQVLGIVNSITTMRNPMVDLDRHYSWIVRLPFNLDINIWACGLLIGNRLLHTAFQAPVFFCLSFYTSPTNPDRTTWSSREPS